MRMSFRLLLCLAVIVFAVRPASAQHGGGHGGGMGGPGTSMGTGSSSSHGNSADKHSSDNHASEGAKISDQLSDNSKLSSKLQSLLPSGTNLQQAAQGFKNLGQFVSAVHVSHNLGISFDELKAKMIGPPQESLGKAIHALKPAANSREETKKGEKQAKQDIDDSKMA